MKAYLNGRFNTIAAAELVEEVARERGEDLDLLCRFNDMWSWTLPASSAEVSGDHSGRALADRLRVMRQATQFHWYETTDDDKITFFVDVSGTPNTIELRLLADTYRIPRDAIQGFLSVFEGTLIDLVEQDGDGPDLVELGCAAGLDKWQPGRCNGRSAQ